MPKRARSKPPSVGSRARRDSSDPVAAAPPRVDDPSHEASGERTLLGLWIGAALWVSSLPYLALWLAADRFAEPGSRYAWILPPYPEDGLAYLAWVKQAAEGALLFHVKYTQIEHAAVIFHPVFLVAGWISAISGWEAGVTLFLVRIAASILCLGLLYAFARLLDLERVERWTFLWLVVASSGVGVLFGPQPLRPADLWMPEFNTLWTLTWNPLFVFGLSLMLVAFLLVSGADERRPIPSYALAGLATGLLAFVHTYDVVMTGAVVGIYSVLRLRARCVGPLLAFGVLAAPACLVQASISLGHPILSAHSAEGEMRSPSVLSYAIGLGIPGLLAIYGMVRARAEGRLERLSIVWIWLLVCLGLAYAPVWFQRKLVFGLHVPVCLLGAIGLVALGSRVGRARPALRTATIVVAIVATTPTHVYNVLRMTERVREDPEAYYRAPSIDRALRWLDREAAPEDLVLAQYALARQIPGASGSFATQGHWAQSIDLDEHRRWIQALFDRRSPLSADARRSALLDSSIDYVVIDPAMLRLWLQGTVPAWLRASGEFVFRDGGVAILEVGASDG